MADLNREQQIKLLQLARKTISDKLGIDEDINLPDLTDEIFMEKAGAFVTIHINKALRGCIGYIQGVKPIPETVKEVSASSAFQDPRFKPLSEKEYPYIDIEISVMSPIEDVVNIDDIVVGRDGLIISQGYKRGLLLPQVPVEQGWDRDTFLTHTCYKAGLSGDSWKKEGVKIEKFSAQVFSEKDLGLL